VSPPAAPDVGDVMAAGPPRRLLLASASPRRLDLLRQIGVRPAAVHPPDIDERPRKAEQPRLYAARMAREKAAAVAALHPDAFVLAADTVVAVGRRILPKTEDEAAARACLEALSGRRHRVHGGICLALPGGRRAERLVTTMVRFVRLTPQEIGVYLAGGEWAGKAGGYAIQGSAAAFIPAINGSYSNVVGLSLPETWSLLRGHGLLD